MAQSTFRVKGMTCQHCVKAVKEEVGALPGVTSVAVDLVPDGVSSLAVASSAPLDPAALAAAIGEAGYELVD
ncbi:MAG: cation transporter [Bifidobacteriaceae bacterium]|jgi:copper ion binding protein|nr:cation transporter [Bifidobacteriaceae bacterium]